MLDHLGKHSLCDLKVRAKGDLQVDDHHTVEDVAICIGEALNEALGDKGGIHRYGSSRVPMDEALADVAIDLSGRAAVAWNVKFTGDKIGTLLIEPIMGNCCGITAKPQYVKDIRELCDRHGVIMIVDEVKTGFRVQSRKSSQDGYRETRRCSTCKQKSLGRWIHIKMPITEAAPAVESR